MQGIRPAIGGDIRVVISFQCYIADTRVKQGDSRVVEAGSFVLAAEDSLVAGAKAESSLVIVAVDSLAAEEEAVEHSPELDSGIGEEPWISWDCKAGVAADIVDIGGAGFRMCNLGLSLQFNLVEVDRDSPDPAGEDSNQIILGGP